MRLVLIHWCGDHNTVLKRVVIDPRLPEASAIREAAAKLNVPVVEGETALQAHDLWVGLSPRGGWGDLAGDTMWARSSEVCLIPDRLAAARIID